MSADLLSAAIRLYHRKEKQAFDDLYARLCLGQNPTKRKGQPVDRVWFWGMNRWGKQWIDTEYKTRESLSHDQERAEICQDIDCDV